MSDSGENIDVLYNWLFGCNEGTNHSNNCSKIYSNASNVFYENGLKKLSIDFENGKFENGADSQGIAHKQFRAASEVACKENGNHGAHGKRHIWDSIWLDASLILIYSITL